MNQRAMRWALGLLLLSAATGYVAMWQLRAREAKLKWDPNLARGANQPIPVRTVKVDERDLQELIGGTAVTLPTRTAVISIPSSTSEVAAREVQQVYFSPGATVRRSETIVDFVPTIFEQIVRQREAMLAKSVRELETMKELYKEKAASGLQVQSAEVALATAQLELELAKRELALCAITSPIDGVIEHIDAVPQMRISDGATLAIVHQLDPIYVEMDFPMERMDALEVGQSAEVTLDAFPQEKFDGKVVQISPVVSTKTRVVPVTVEVANPDNRVRAGISGFARVMCHKAVATTVPSVAVIRNQEKAMVVCVEDSRAKIREIHTGPIIQAGHIEVLDGLALGDEVIVFGQDAVRENDVVNADWREWTRRTSPMETLQ